MKYWIGLPLCVLLAVVAFHVPANGFWIEVAGKLPILLSVVLAAIFVRLARGFPPIPYEKIDQSKALTATAAFRKLVRSYLITVIVIIIAILIDVTFSSIDVKELNPKYLPYISSIVALFNSFILLSLFSLISSDVLISNIQADLIDEVISQNSFSNAEETQKNVQKSFKVKDGRDAKISNL